MTDWERIIDMGAYEHLFKPLRVGNLLLKNRFEVSPTARKDLTDLNHHNLNNKAYFRSLASSGAALVTVGDCPVHPTGSVPYSYKVALYDNRSECGLNEVADSIHREGALASVELQHVGVHFTMPDKVNYGPSPMISKKGHKVVEMPKNIIAEVAQAYADAAFRAKKVGFDMCLVHIGHGWLLSQFLSPAYNRRTDEYGGSPERRTQIVIDVVKAIREKCGKNFGISVRMSWEEAIDGGYTLDDMKIAAKLIEPYVDMYQISHGSLDDDLSIVLTSPSIFQPHALNLDAAAEIKKMVSKPVSVVGNIWDCTVMEKAVADGKVDMFAMARTFIAENQFVKKLLHGQEDQIRPCLKCNTCLDCGYENITLRCAVNPQIGRDYEQFFVTPPATEKLTVLIAGGGPAGMQAAQTASKRGHRVILCEKSDKLGGALILAGTEPYKELIRKYTAYMARMTMNSGAEVRLNMEVTPELISEINPDRVIVAIGAQPFIPAIKGAENAVEITDLYRNHIPVNGKTVVIGGGFVGSEAAIGFAQEGHDTTIVEMAGELTPGATEMKKMAIRLEVKTLGIHTELGAVCREITPNGVIIEQNGETKLVPADTVVLAVGFRPKTDEAEKLMAASAESEYIGDCRKVAQIEQAVRAGYDAAMAL